MHGPAESPKLKNDYERVSGWHGNLNKSEMAVFFSERTHAYAQKALDPPTLSETRCFAS
jgi:hypothetical protein